jgi:hypothetical protein
VVTLAIAVIAVTVITKTATKKNEYRDYSLCISSQDTAWETWGDNIKIDLKELVYEDVG